MYILKIDYKNLTLESADTRTVSADDIIAGATSLADKASFASD